MPILSKNKKSAHQHVLSCSKKLRLNGKKKNAPEPTVFVKQIILTRPTSYWICITFTLNSSESVWGRWKLFLVFMPFCYSASWSCLVSRRVLLSSLWVSLFFLKVLAFLWSRHCCSVFDVSRGDGSESSPVSFHVSLKVDFEPVSVKLGLIATTGSTYTHTQRRGKLRISRQSRRGCCCMLKSNCFSWWTRQFDGSHLFGVSLFSAA